MTSTRPLHLIILIGVWTLLLSACEGLPWKDAPLPAACETKCQPLRCRLPENPTMGDSERNVNCIVRSYEICRTKHNACVEAIR